MLNCYILYQVLDYCNKMERLNSKFQNNFSVFLYIISMALAFNTRYGDLELGFQLQITIGLFWLTLGFCKFSINKYRFNGFYKRDYSCFIKLYLLPHIVLHLYTILLMSIGIVEWTYLTSCISVYVPTLLSIVAIYLFGTIAYSYTCIALMLSWFISVGLSVVLKGPGIFIDAIIQAYIDPLAPIINYLELHDLVLSIGYIIVAYVFSESKLTTRQLFLLLMVFIIMILGMKRIALLGLIFSLLFYYSTRSLTYKKKYKVCLLLGIIGIVVCYLYVYLFSDGSLFYDFISSIGINMMGRNYYYKEILNLATFSPTFLGIGRNVVTQILNTELSYLHVGGVHSDVIKLYVESGFIFFGIWLWYNLVYLLKFYKKNYGSKAAVLYFGIVIYMFTLYLTDNVEIYFISQILSVMIPVTYAIKLKESKKNCNCSAPLDS